ncbi:sugar ABC transporter substrate-binding protein [Kitasatospora nipponensis]|uniref:Sugar ABC transporter substrate-binding protein n=1 Tax=Kitasatospora nipponensis TaxID=258049 RepID=A0ABN1W8M9_9ACTN
MKRWPTKTARPRAAALAALALSVALTGCGVSGEKTSAAPSAGGAIEGEITLRTLELKPKFTDYVQGVIDAFQQKYPQVKVKWEDVPGDGYNDKLVTDAQAGTLPDVVNVNTDSFDLLAGRDQLADIGALDPSAKDRYVQGAWDTYRSPGRSGTYAYPWYVTPEIMSYNSDLAARAGVDLSHTPATVDAYFDIAEQAAKASGGAYYAFMADPGSRLPGDWQKMGIPLLAADRKSFVFDTPDAVHWVQRMKDLYAEGAMPKDSLTDGKNLDQLFGSGKLLFGPGSPNFLAQVKENSPQTYPKIKVLPAVTGTLGHIGIYTQALAVNRTSQHATAADALASWVTNGPNQVAFSKIVSIYPSNTDGLADPYFADPGDGSPVSQSRVVGATALRSADIDANTPAQWNSAVGDAVKALVQKAMKGEISPADALAQAQRQANQLLAEKQ